MMMMMMEDKVQEVARVDRSSSNVRWHRWRSRRGKR